jgi:hypothetical protein
MQRGRRDPRRTSLTVPCGYGSTPANYRPSGRTMLVGAPGSRSGRSSSHQFSVAAFAEPRSMLMARKRAAQAFPRGRSRPKAEGVTAQPSPTIEQVLNGLTPAARSRTKKPRTMPGLKLLEIWRRSVTSYNRALTKIEVIVKPRRNQIHILPDPIGYLQRACRPKTSNYPGREQPDVPVTHEKMVIFDPD